MTTDDRTAIVRRYYAAIDGGDYDALEALLADEFVQRRPDRTLVGAAAFVAFMRDERPMTDAEHVLEAVYAASDAPEAAARGSLVAGDGEEVLSFVDVFSFDDGQVRALRTYTDR